MTLALDFPRPLTTVDVVTFGIQDGLLKVLLVRRPIGADEPFPGLWALPGGFLDTGSDANLESCAKRKLREKTIGQLGQRHARPARLVGDACLFRTHAG